MSTIDSVDVSVSDIAQNTLLPLQVPGREWLVTFKSLSGDIPSMLVSTDGGVTSLVKATGSKTASIGLTGTLPGVAVSEVTKGGIPKDYTFTGLSNTKRYYTRVTSYNTVSEVGTTATGSFSLQPANTVPGIPQKVKMSRYSVTSMGISWSAPSYTGGSAISKYAVQYSQDSSFATYGTEV